MRRSQRRGFAMFTVVMMVAVVSIVGVTLMDLVSIDVLIAGNERRSAEAREVAEGAMMELINDEMTPGMLPMLDGPNLQVTLQSSSGSQFTGTFRTFNATAELLRIAPISESSHTFSRAIVHEISVQSEVGRGEAGFEVSAEIYRTASFRPGMVLPRRHSR